MNEYLSFLLRKKFVEVVVQNGGTTYKTTPKGLKYLQSYKQVKDLLRKKKVTLGTRNRRLTTRLTAKRKRFSILRTQLRLLGKLRYSACP